jgi:neutral amino acid transport system substrate-binding protein
MPLFSVRKLAVALTVITLFEVCEQSRSLGASQTHLKIGSLLPITGDLGPVGQPMSAIMPLFVEQVNQCGGVNGQSIELVVADDETEPSVGYAAMSRLVKVDKVAGVVGSFASSISQTALDVAVRNKVMLVSPGSTSPMFTVQAKNGDFKGYWARTVSSDTYQARTQAKLAYTKGLRRVSTVAINNDYGVRFEREFIAAFKKLGGFIVNEQKPTRYDPKAANYKTLAEATFKGKPDGVVAILYAETGALFLKASYKERLTQGVQLLLTDSVKFDDFAQVVGKTKAGKFIIEGALGTAPGAEGKALNSLTQLWKTRFKGLLPAYVPQTWDAAALLVLAAQAAQSNTGEAISRKIREVSGGPGEEVTDVCQGLAWLKEGKKINYQGASGNVDLDENGDVSGVYEVWRVEPNGKIKVVDKILPTD